MSWIQKSWWVILFCAAVGLVHLHALKNRNAALREEDLQMRIASQNDPAWIEMVLMREIGVVPEGWIKVHFKTK